MTYKQRVSRIITEILEADEFILVKLEELLDLETSKEDND